MEYETQWRGTTPDGYPANVAAVCIDCPDNGLNRPSVDDTKGSARGMLAWNEGRKCWPAAYGLTGNAEKDDVRGLRLASSELAGSKSISELVLSWGWATCLSFDHGSWSDGWATRLSSDHGVWSDVNINKSCCFCCDSSCWSCCVANCCCLPTLALAAALAADTTTAAVAAGGSEIPLLPATGDWDCRSAVSAARGRCRGLTEVLSISDAEPTPLRLHRHQQYTNRHYQLGTHRCVIYTQHLSILCTFYWCYMATETTWLNGASCSYLATFAARVLAAWWRRWCREWQTTRETSSAVDWRHQWLVQLQLNGGCTTR